MLDQIQKRDFRKITAAGMAVWLLMSIVWFCGCDKASLSFEGTFNIATGIVVEAGMFLLALICAMDQTEPDKSTGYYYLLIVFIALGTVVDHFVWIYEFRTDRIWVTILCVVVDFIVTQIIVCTLWFYQDCLYPSKNEKNSWIPGFLLISLVLNIIYIIIGTITGFVFYINEYNKYSIGPGYLILFFFPTVTAFLNIYCNIHREMPKRVRVALLIFNLFPITCGFMIIFSGKYCVQYIALMMTMLFMYGTIQMENSLERIEQVKKISEQQQDLMEKQTQMMISQIQPHFLFNALNAIYYLCGKDAKLAKKMILMFSDYLRVNMDSIKSKEPIPFEKELAHTKTYLEIELLRFGNILNLVYDIQEKDFVLPALSLQPLVENAVKYGIRGREEGGTVTISTRREENRVYITVSDDGMGFDPTRLPEDGRSHVGIENVRARLEAMCGGKLLIESTKNVGTVATIILEEKV
ncbi:MAG: histidine kinase [Dorea sp.]|nr:histidine kinase [Dorea sp.]